VAAVVATVSTCSWAFAAQPRDVPVPKTFCIAFEGLGDRMQIDLAPDRSTATPGGAIRRFKISGIGFIGFPIVLSGGGADAPDTPRFDASFDGGFGAEELNQTLMAQFELHFTPGPPSKLQNTGTGMIFYNYPDLGIRNRSSVTQLPCGEAFNQAVNAAKAARALGVERFSTDTE
jgi:hypothetical protein